MAASPLPLEPAQEVQLDGNGAAVEIGEKASRLGIEIASVAGLIGDLSKLDLDQSTQLHEVASAARQIRKANHLLAGALEQTRDMAEKTRLTLGVTAEVVSATLGRSVHKTEQLSARAIELRDKLVSVGETIVHLTHTTAAIQTAARETQLRALNAGIDATLTGTAGLGANADAVKSLAEQIRAFAQDNERQLSALAETLAGLRVQAETSAEVAAAAMADSSAAQDKVARIAMLADGVLKLIQDIDGMAAPIDDNILHYTAVTRALKALVGTMKQSGDQLSAAKMRVQTIQELGDAFMLYIAENGVKTAETVIMPLCKEGAAAVTTLFERSVAAGDIGMDVLFDENYMPIPNTDPQQFMTRYVAFTDRFLPAVQDPMMMRDPRIVFCACVDRNFYLPTHNRIYSRPQSGDSAWNAANCRNRRFYGKRRANEKDSLKPVRLQTFRRDMGGGTLDLIKTMSAPIFVRGHYWGSYVIGYRA
jgi:methyl-accepting chemotaxis protein